MFNNPRAQAPFRIERIRLNLQSFCYTVGHFHGARNPSDYLSRQSISTTEEDLRQTEDLDAYVNCIFQSPVIEPVISLEELKHVLNKERVALKLKTAVENGTIDKNDTDLKCCLKIFGHQEIVKTK